MPVGLRVTEELFIQLKDELLYSEPLTVAIKNHMSIKTILQIKGSQFYTDYVAMKKAQHPPTKYSMRQEITNINEKLDRLLYAASDNRLL